MDCQKQIGLNQEKSNRVSGNQNSKEQQRKEIRLFIIVMLVFTIGMASLLIYDISTWWIWYLYFAIWTLIELKIAKNIRLKWWWWLIIITFIIFIDFAVVELVDYFR
jgi:heme/copper-type cytochrome/quinol oxidase subunit 2